MTITVVRGVVGRTDQLTHDSQKTNDQPQQQPAQVMSTAIQISRSLSQDAVISSLRPARVSFAGERIRDSREARDIAEKAAEEIRSLDKDDSEELHSGVANRAASASSLLK